MNEGVEPDQIGGAERGALGVPDQRAGQEVDLLDRQAHLLHDADHVEHGEHADPVGHEVGRVAGDDDALAQSSVGELLRGSRRPQGPSRSRG